MNTTRRPLAHNPRGRYPHPTASRCPGRQNGATRMTSPGLIAMYAALAWLVASTAAGILLGRTIRLADQHADQCCPNCETDQP